MGMSKQSESHGRHFELHVKALVKMFAVRLDRVIGYHSRETTNEIRVATYDKQFYLEDFRVCVKT